VGLLHVDGAFEPRTVLQTNAGSDEIAFDIPRGLDDDLLLTKEISTHLSLYANDPGMDVGADHAGLADSHTLALDPDLALDLSLYEDLFFS
jgi:hypothetical protein